MTTLLTQAFSLLEEDLAISCDDRVRERMAAYHDLIAEWNPKANLVSGSDIERLDVHTVDSLSLIPYMGKRSEPAEFLMDVGSGAGFPAIPIKIVLGETALCLIERNRTKAAFLRKVVGHLGLNDTEVISLDFAELSQKPCFHTVTGRAIERPASLMSQITELLQPDACFLCQFPPDSVPAPIGFKSTLIRDEWTDRGLRRGSLRVIRSI